MHEETKEQPKMLGSDSIDYAMIGEHKDSSSNGQQSECKS